MPKKFIQLLLISCMALFLSSCGYRFSGEGDGPKKGLHLIAVPVFENKTSEPDLGAIFAGALSREFMQKGNMRVVSVEEADAVFKGTITGIRVSAVAHHPTGIVSSRVTVENRLYINMDIRCEDKATRKVLWMDPNFIYHKVYHVSDDALHPDAIAGFENRQAALQSLARETAIRIHDRFLSNF